MAQGVDLSLLRSRVALLVDREAELLQQALALSRQGADRSEVDALMAKVQAMQSERILVKQQITRLLGVRRMHSADEVWLPGTYEYSSKVGGNRMLVQVERGPLGLSVRAAGGEAVRIETMPGFFEGPLGHEGNELLHRG